MTSKPMKKASDGLAEGLSELARAAIRDAKKERDPDRRSTAIRTAGIAVAEARKAEAAERRRTEELDETDLDAAVRAMSAADRARKLREWSLIDSKRSGLA